MYTLLKLIELAEAGQIRATVFAWHLGCLFGCQEIDSKQKLAMCDVSEWFLGSPYEQSLLGEDRKAIINNSWRFLGGKMNLTSLFF